MTLPGGTTLADLAPGVGRWLGRGPVDLEVASVERIEHVITAPTTADVHRVRLVARDVDGRGASADLIAKRLRPARYGLPPQMPDDARDHLDRTIPWRLEADLVATLTPDRFPPGLRPARTVAVVEGDDEVTLWQEHVAVAGVAWTPDDVVRAAGLLGRLAARRVADPVPWTGVTFVRSFLDDAVRTWAAPLLRDPAAWGHPAFTAAVERGLEEPVQELLDDLATDDGLGVVPWTSVPALPAHGDPTPDNLLRPVGDPSSYVMIDWASATRAPMGWDVVPLVFGPAEAGRAPASEAVTVLPCAIDAYADGLEAEGHPVDRTALAAAVRALTRMRYGITVLPLDALVGGRARTSERASQADLVATVLRL